MLNINHDIIFFYTNDGGIETIYNENIEKLLCHLILEYFIYSVIESISLTLESVLFISHTEALCANDAGNLMTIIIIIIFQR